MYNVVILTGNGYLAAFRMSERMELTNEELQQELFENAKVISENSVLSVDSLAIQTGINVDETMVSYEFQTIIPAKEKLREILQHAHWNKSICCTSRRPRKKQTLRLMKGIITFIENNL